MQVALFQCYLTEVQVLVFLAVVVLASCDCRVSVQDPWPDPYLLVPQHSTVTVEINCTALNNDSTPFWAIHLDGRNSAQVRANDGTIFRDHGFFVLPKEKTSGMPPTLRLLINDTARNNQTVIICSDHHSLDLSTTLFIFELTPLQLHVNLEVLNVANISWTQESPIADIDQEFSLRISHGSHLQLISLNESYYYFTGPEGVPPCEVYNFSVTATYVGATYTGADCSVPSHMLSTMLPSLPNISRLESSLDYVLMKLSTGFTLYISFEPASYCEKYPIINYTLEVNGTQTKIQVSEDVTSAENFMIGGDLSENAVYSFRILVANTVGVVSTSDRKFYTTDVQAVTATLIKGVNASTIQCEFIEDSNATGCIVVLTTINGQKVYYNLTKNQSTNLTAIAVTLEHPPPCYSGVEAFDIESNGSVGSLSIPGHIVNPSQAPCTPSTLPVKPSSSGTVLEAWMIAVISVVVVIIILLTAVIIVIVCVCKSKKSQERVFRCPCMCQCSADAQVEHQVQIQVENLSNESISEEKHLPDQLKDDARESITAAEGGMKTACSDTLTDCQLEEPVSLYSEIASTSKLGKCTTPGGGGGKCENVYSAPGSKGPLTKRGKTSVPLEEKLYDQPVDALERTPGDGADYNRTSYGQQTSPVPMNDLATAYCHGVQYSTLDKTEDHIYFILESNRPRHNIIPSPTCTSPQTPFIPDTKVPPPSATTSVSPPPVYQEITEISSRRGGSATRAVTANGDSNTPLSSAQGATDKSNQCVDTNINVKHGTMA